MPEIFPKIKSDRSCSANKGQTGGNKKMWKIPINILYYPRFISKFATQSNVIAPFIFSAQLSWLWSTRSFHCDVILACFRSQLEFRHLFSAFLLPVWSYTRYEPACHLAFTQKTSFMFLCSKIFCLFWNLFLENLFLKWQSDC